jgi:hypothetical protein
VIRISQLGTLSLWAQTARNLGSITQAEVALHLIGL